MKQPLPSYIVNTPRGLNIKTTLFTFANDKDRDRFFKIIREAGDTMLGSTNPAIVADGEYLKTVLGTVRLDPAVKQDHERVVALFVSGRKMSEGTMEGMRQRFRQEVDSHHATVELKELREGEWVVIQSRRPQRVG